MKTNKTSDINIVDLRSGYTKIAVFGLGHVGASIASVWLRAGVHVIGVDKSKKVLENARNGRTHIPEPGINEAYTIGLKESRFYVYDDPVKASRDAKIKIICVPVLAQDGSADLSAVIDVAKSISMGLKKGDVVSLNPSVPTGTTENVVIPILEAGNYSDKRSFHVERDFYMIYNPERIYEGRAIKDIEENYPAIVSGAGEKSVDIGIRLLSFISKKGVITVSNIRTAETEKLLEGVYRDVNIALANELAIFCERAGVNFWEAREAANSQPFCHIHRPGAGVGGACIPVYPQFVLKAASQLGIDCALTKTSRKINDAMPDYCVRQALRILDSKKSTTNRNKGEGLTVTLLGLAFRGDVSDTRLSPTYSILDELGKRGITRVKIHDPLVLNDIRLQEYKDVILTSNLREAVIGSDLVILVADHAEYRNLSQDLFDGIPIYDGRGVLNSSRFNSSLLAIIGRPT